MHMRVCMNIRYNIRLYVYKYFVADDTDDV